MYKIIIENKAQKDIRKLPNKIFEQIDSAIISLETNPRPYNSKKLRGTDGRRIRVGDYRILYHIDDTNHIVAIFRERHRREAYR